MTGCGILDDAVFCSNEHGRQNEMSQHDGCATDKQLKVIFLHSSPGSRWCSMTTRMSVVMELYECMNYFVVA